MIPRAIIFDLDGTLLDTLDDLTASLNRALAERCLPPHPARRVRRMIGDGVHWLVRRALPRGAHTPELEQDLVRAFRRDYNRRWDQATRPYPGVPELLDQLAAAKLPLAVLSNKPHEFCVQMVDSLLADWAFHRVIGGGDAFALKPDPAGALEIATTLDVPPADCMLVGDSMVDIQTAHAAGMVPVAVTWGFRDEEELREAAPAHVLSKAHQLLDIL